MQILLSPAKSLTYDNPVPESVSHQSPLFIEKAQQLIEILRGYEPNQLASLMKLSDKLAALNVARYQQWSPNHECEDTYPAVYFFDGDVYKGLDVTSLADEKVNMLNDHLLLLSGLYGVLRPLDRIYPYRLEMGTKLENPAGKNLYAFWKELNTDYINQRLHKAEHSDQVVINLASNEYFKSIDKKALKYPIISPEFKDWKNGQHKVISFFAKKARGQMARYLIENDCKLSKLKGFDVDGYQYNESLSTDAKPVFTRHQ